MLDNEPAVISGYSLTEFIFSVCVNLAVWPFVFAFLGLFFGQPVFGGIIGFAIAIPAIIFIGKKLERSKEGKPVGYYSLKVKAILNTYLKFGFVHQNSRWSIFRSR